MITNNDMKRLISELAAQPNSGDDHVEWCEANDIDPEVIEIMVNMMGRAMMASAILSDDTQGAFGSAILTAFIMGWETHKQYGNVS